MKTKSFTVGHPREIVEKMSSLIDDAFSPSIAFVFSTPRLGIDKVSKAFSGYDIYVVGSSSGGNILTNGKDNAIFEDSAVVTLVELDERKFVYLCKERLGQNSFDFGQSIGEWGAAAFKKPSFIIVASGMDLNGQEFVEGIMDKAGEGVSMFGGLASDETKFFQNYVFSGKKVLESGAIVLAFDSDAIAMNGIATSGWVGLGKDLRITSSESNIVYSIDNEPALRVYKKYLSVQDNDLPAIGVEYPLLIKRNKDNYTLRAVMGVDRKKEALIFAGTVPQDSIVTFSSSPGFEVLDRTKEKMTDFYKENKDADMILLFSCMARHLALGPMITEEITYPALKWNLPVSGFFTYGEIGTNPGKICDFFNQTYTLVVLKEK